MRTDNPYVDLTARYDTSHDFADEILERIVALEARITAIECGGKQSPTARSRTLSEKASRVVSIVSALSGYSGKQIMPTASDSRSRAEEIVQYRHLAMMLCNEDGLHPHCIARCFSIDPGTVRNGIARSKERITIDKHLARMAESVRAQLRLENESLCQPTKSPINP